MIVKTKQIKCCSRCKRIKSIAKFCKNRSTRDGYSYWCESCNRDYNQSLKGKAAKKRHNIKRRKYYPNQVKAMNAVNNAIRDGKLPRVINLFCHYCRKKAEQYHHYLGYEQEHWFDIIPVCKKCHRKNPQENQTVSCEK